MKLTSDDAYDVLAMLLQARRDQEHALKEAIRMLGQVKKDPYPEALGAAEYAVEDVVIQEQIQCVIDAIEMLADELPND